MTYAEEREYSSGQKRALVTKVLIERGSISIAEVVELCGCGWWNAFRILCDIEAVIPMYKDKKSKRRIYIPPGR